jgi:hypothetical protein
VTRRQALSAPRPSFWQVRLTYASRDERHILYREQLHELLLAHASHFEVRHCLSRPEQRLGDSEGGGEGGGEGGEGSASEGLATGDVVTSASCLAGERQTRGRVDAATLHGEYAAWRPLQTAYVDVSGGTAEESEKREKGEAEGEPYFLVVGSRQQEHAALQWLRESGLQARPLLAGGRWRSLVPGS